MSKESDFWEFEDGKPVIFETLKPGNHAPAMPSPANVGRRSSAATLEGIHFDPVDPDAPRQHATTPSKPHKQAVSKQEIAKMMGEYYRSGGL